MYNPYNHCYNVFFEQVVIGFNFSHNVYLFKQLEITGG
jgi:hypothetical protein